MLLHVNEREEHVLHLGVKIGVFFLVWVQNDAWGISQGVSFLVNHLFAEVIPVKEFALELDSLFEIFIEELKAALIQILIFNHRVFFIEFGIFCHNLSLFSLIFVRSVLKLQSDFFKLSFLYSN